MFEFPDTENRGWMGGCNLGLKAASGYDYVILANDDILVPSVCDWLKSMIDVMEDKKECGILTPVTVNAMGWVRLSVQNCTINKPYAVPYCSFYFVMLRKEMVDKIGLLDEDLPGGDDLDYCYRAKKAGYVIGVNPHVFVWHHYAQTGKRIHGEYWDSKEHNEKIKFALIKKHGFKEWIDSEISNHF